MQLDDILTLFYVLYNVSFRIELCYWAQGNLHSDLAKLKQPRYKDHYISGHFPCANSVSLIKSKNGTTCVYLSSRFGSAENKNHKCYVTCGYC